MPRIHSFAVAVTLAGLACAHGRTAPPPPAPASLPFMNPDLPLEQRVADLVGRLTLEEKAGQMGYAAPAIPRLGIPAYTWWNEALHGVARAGRATVFPQAIGLAATWDRGLMLRVATTISVEARAKHNESLREGSHGIYEGLTFWSPNINIFRDPRWGRGMETYGEDPYLVGQLAVQFVRGMQGDDPRYLRTIATPKHFDVHSGPEPERHTFNAVVSRHDLYDTYLPQFEAAIVDGGARSIMCAYNAVYGEPACASQLLLGDILRKQWGFAGYVVSDCGAVSDVYEGHHAAPDETHAAALTLAAGTDLSCGSEYDRLPQAVRAGLVSEAALDTAVARLFRARFRLGMFDPPARVSYAAIPPDSNDSPAHRALARKAADEAIVLLKNEGALLPLKPGVRQLVVIGPNADNLDALVANYHGTPAAPVTPLAGLAAWGAAHGVRVTYARGADLAPNMPSLTVIPDSALHGLTASYFANHDLAGAAFAERAEATLDHQWWRDPPLPGMPRDGFSVRWTATLAPRDSGRYAIGVRALGHVRLLLDDSSLIEFSERHEPQTQSVWMHFAAGQTRRLTVEYADRRPDASIHLLWAPPAPHLLDDAVAAARAADVAVLFLGLSPRLEGEEMRVPVPGFAGGDRVSIALPDPQQLLLRAVVATGTPTVLVLMSGSALAVPWAAEHVPAILEAWYPGEGAGQAIADVLSGAVSPAGRLPVTFYRSVDDLPPFADYAMANRTYRYFLGQALFPFGYGLSYARFDYRDLQLPAQVRAGDSVTVAVDVHNTGAVTADEVVELYVSAVHPVLPAPIRSLAGFQRITLAPGEQRRVAFRLDGRAFSLVNDAGARVVEPGTYEVAVGGKQPGQHGLADAATTEVVTGRVAIMSDRP
jgi:beta-glucosidase